MQTLLLGTILLLSLAAGAIFAIGCGLSGPHHHGPVSDHFDGRHFLNQLPVAHRNPGELLRWWWTQEPGPWREWTDAEPGPRPPARVADGRLRVTFVNHATVLLQMDGLNILTDPIWSQRASPFTWAGPRRVSPPGIRFADLPPIDAVIVSHNHYDHLDLPSLKRLQRVYDPLFVVGLGNAALLPIGAYRPAWFMARVHLSPREVPASDRRAVPPAELNGPRRPAPPTRAG